jgi:ATP-dependent protease ClpP protease subunit
MKRFNTSLFGILLALVMTTALWAGQAVELRLKDGSTWRGETDQQIELVFMQEGVQVTMAGRLLDAKDLYIKVEGDIAGKHTTRVIFNSDLVSVRSLGSDAKATDDQPRTTTRQTTDKSADNPGKPGNEKAKSGHGPYVFLLPCEGMVGESLRHEEIVKIGEHADEYGPGQIIVLRIASNGGLVSESEQINDAIWELRERHRVVAWIHKAFSAGCSTAMACHEIYMMTEGAAGSVTTINGSSAIQGPEQDIHIDSMVRTATKSGYSEHIARAMKASRFMCSYDKDEETGEVTFYPDLSGKYVLSDGSSNLCFTSSNAVHCGFAKGIADNEEELAKLLDLDHWNEPDDVGREIAKDWQDTVERAKKAITDLSIQYQVGGTGTGDPLVVYGTQLKVIRQLIRWWKRAPNVCMLNGVPPVEYLENQEEELRRAIARLRENR